MQKGTTPLHPANNLIVILCGGDKDSQDRDIEHLKLTGGNTKVFKDSDEKRSQ